MKGCGLLIYNFNNKNIFKVLKILIKVIHLLLKQAEDDYKPKIRYL